VAGNAIGDRMRLNFAGVPESRLLERLAFKTARLVKIAFMEDLAPKGAITAFQYNSSSSPR